MFHMKHITSIPESEIKAYNQKWAKAKSNIKIDGTLTMTSKEYIQHTYHKGKKIFKKARGGAKSGSPVAKFNEIICL